jgi:hypothetical protein
VPTKIPAASRLAVALSVILLGCVLCTAGAQTLAEADLPDAPMPFSSSSLVASPMMGTGVMLPPPAPKPEPHAAWRSPMALSWYALAASDTFDMIETHRNLSHPQWLCGINPQSSAVTIAAPSRDQIPATLSQVCGLSPSGQAANYAYEGSFQETGWTTQLGLASSRNFGAVLGWNLGFDASEAIVPVLFRHRMSRRALLMTELTNVAHAAAHIYGGMTNVERLNGPAGSPNTYFDGTSAAVQLNQLYPGPRWWGRK